MSKSKSPALKAKTNKKKQVSDSDDSYEAPTPKVQAQKASKKIVKQTVKAKK